MKMRKPWDSLKVNCVKLFGGLRQFFVGLAAFLWFLLLASFDILRLVGELLLMVFDKIKKDNKKRKAIPRNYKPNKKDEEGFLGFKSPLLEDEDDKGFNKDLKW